MTAKVLMVVGTTSSAGKSLLVTALCRAYARQGVRVAPFKAQNMSNNAAVCADGSEIGRAQAVQALAAGLAPTVEMNPVLIKPEADARAQVVVMGRPWRTLEAYDYHHTKEVLWGKITSSLDRLRETHELVIIEGAGSPVEMNLKDGDLVNMAVARYANAPVLLVGDIDRGGIFAQLLGTLWLLPPEELALMRGLVVNKFRGDLRLFSDGVDILEQRGHVPVLGVLPYQHDLQIPEEDAVALDDPLWQAISSLANITINVIHVPHISNFDDFDPITALPGVQVRYVASVDALGEADAIILPGTKSTAGDLAWLDQTGLAEAITAFAGHGGAVVGICGGYQMLGTAVHDDGGVEGEPQTVAGLDLLPIQTDFVPQKATYQVMAHIEASSSWLASLAGQSLVGYEIHMGRTRGHNAWLRLTTRNEETVSVADGAISEDGRIWGCYLHGLFANAEFTRAWLQSLGWTAAAELEAVSMGEELIQRSLDRLADAVEEALDMVALEEIIWGS